MTRLETSKGPLILQFGERMTEEPKPPPSPTGAPASPPPAEPRATRPERPALTQTRVSLVNLETTDDD